MFRSNSALIFKNIYDPSLLTPAKINSSISNLHSLLASRKRKLNPSYGTGSFGVINDFITHHKAKEPKPKEFIPHLKRITCSPNTSAPMFVNSTLEPNVPQEEKSYNKDEYLFDKIFQKIFRCRFEKTELIDNRLNIFYADNEEQFEANMKKINEALALKGKTTKHRKVKYEYINDKITDIKDKITFMKGVSNYSFPAIVIKRLDEAYKAYAEDREEKKRTYLPPVERVNKMQVKRNNLRRELLSAAISIRSEKSVKGE